MGSKPFQPPHPPEAEALPATARKGRGAVSNPTGRFEHETRFRVDDGWDRPDEDELPRLETSVGLDTSRTIIARNDSPDVPFDRSINPYRGCEHGCVYCFARPSHAYYGLSPGLDFETKLFAKPDAVQLLESELRAKSYRAQVMALGTNTDPYQPIEREHRITRGILETLARFNHPVSIVTKSALVVRDIDILAPMAAKRMARVAVSVTTLDRDLARRLEPRAPTPSRRLLAIKALAEAGIPTAVMTAPMIPGLNDQELESILEAAREHGATEAGYTVLRLPLEIKQLFVEWLETHAPLKKDRVLTLIRGMRDGKLNNAEFGQRMVGSGPYAELIQKRFRLAVKRLGMDKRRWQFDLSQFKPPPRPGDQLTLGL